MKNQKQSRKLSTTGSFVNWLMGNNQSKPIVGKGATELCWTDRHAYEVLEVSDDGMSCVIDQYVRKRVDKNGLSEMQEYVYDTLHKNPQRIVWRKKQGGCWCKHTKELRIIPKVKKELDLKSHKYFESDQIMEVYGKGIHDKVYQYDDNGDRILKPVEGITKLYDQYDKINLLFGEKREYWDPSF